MDKSTLSNYGWIVIVVLVLSVMTALATPFGEYIEKGVKNTTEGLFNTSEAALNVVEMTGGSGTFDENDETEKDATMNPSGVIPEGATYTHYINFDGYMHEDGWPYIYTYDDVVQLSAGDEFPENVSLGDIYTYDEYQYCYGFEWCCDTWSYICECGDEIETLGWAVRFIGENNPGLMLDSINGKPIVSLGNTFSYIDTLTTVENLTIPKTVVSMYCAFGFTPITNEVANLKIPQSVKNVSRMFLNCKQLTDMSGLILPNNTKDAHYLFSGCSSLTKAPVLPDSITDIQGIFQNCTSLEVAPKLPQKTTNMMYAFFGCTTLIETPEIPSKVTNMMYAFYKCEKITVAPILPNAVNQLRYAFAYCISMSSYVGSADAEGDFTNYIIPSDATDWSSLFQYCEKMIKAPVIPETVENLYGAFWYCTALTEAPNIPNSVTNLELTFAGCSSLNTYRGNTDENGDFRNYIISNNVTTLSNTFAHCSQLVYAPDLSNATNVINLIRTFDGCTSLTDTITINTTLVTKNKVAYCLVDTTQPIVLTGLCPILEDIAKTSTANNITIQ